MPKHRKPLELETPSTGEASPLTRPLVRDSLWQIVVGSDELGWRDITEEVDVKSLQYSTVRPGGYASCSFSLMVDSWDVGYNELRTDARCRVSYGGVVVWVGFVLPRGLDYEGG
jgi:hypothetical protein